MDYTTTDISKHLGIKRERLKIWMSKGFITPSQTASGPGTKNLFSITDLYLLKLFASLVERGFPREEAAERLRMTRQFLNPDIIGTLILIGFFRHDKEPEKPGYPLVISYDSKSKFAKDSKYLLDEFFKHDCDDILIFNFKKIREEVDKALS